MENFFGSCKGHCGAKPIASHFRCAYTTLIINNLIGPVSDGSNCEQDKFFALLSNINEMLLDYDDKTDETDNNIEHTDIESINEAIMLDTIVFDPLFGEEPMNFIENESISNTSSSICRKLMDLTNCDDCRISLQEPLPNRDELDIILPSKTFKTHFEKIFSALNVAIPYFCSEKSVKKKIISQIESVEVDTIGCNEHCKEMAMNLKDLTANYTLFAFCNSINNILSNKISTLPPGYNHMQEKAFIFRQKKSRIGKYSDIFTQ